VIILELDPELSIGECFDDGAFNFDCFFFCQRLLLIFPESGLRLIC
jgi:hypothetical protein